MPVPAHTSVVATIASHPNHPTANPWALRDERGGVTGLARISYMGTGAGRMVVWRLCRFACLLAMDEWPERAREMGRGCGRPVGPNINSKQVDSV